MTKMTGSQKGDSAPPGQRTLLLGESALLDPLLRIGLPFRPSRVSGWRELFAAVVREHPATVVAVDPYAGRAEPEDSFWELLERFPSSTVVPVVRAGPEHIGQLQQMLNAGASEIINLALDDVAVAARRLRGAHARPFKRAVDAELTRFLHVDARMLLFAAAEVAVSGGGAGELADKFGVHPRTLVRWCRRTGLPEPRRLQAWMRVLLASQLLDDSDHTMWDVAVACGYATDRSLRRVIKGLLKVELDVRVLRRTGVFKAAIRGFNDELRQLREGSQAVSGAAREGGRSDAGQRGVRGDCGAESRWRALGDGAQRRGGETCRLCAPAAP